MLSASRLGSAILDPSSGILVWEIEQREIGFRRMLFLGGELRVPMASSRPDRCWLYLECPKIILLPILFV